jgi:hypothetical protein
VAEAVGAPAVIGRVFLVFAQVGAERVGLLQYPVGPYPRRDSFYDPVVIARPTEVLAPPERAGYVAVAFGGGAAYDVGKLVTAGPHELVRLVFILERGKGGFHPPIAH